MGSRVRMIAGLGVLAEVLVFIAVAAWIGLGWTLVAALATSALGWLLLARQGRQALQELRDRAAARQPAGRALGDAGLVALGGLLMVLPGFLGDLLGLLCLLPGTRALPRAIVGALIGRGLLVGLPDRFARPVRVRSTRAGRLAPPDVGGPAAGNRPAGRTVIEGAIEGEVVSDVTGTPGAKPARGPADR